MEGLPPVFLHGCTYCPSSYGTFSAWYTQHFYSTELEFRLTHDTSNHDFAKSRKSRVTTSNARCCHSDLGLELA